MQKRRKLKKSIKIAIFSFVLVALLGVTFKVINTTNDVSTVSDDFVYVNDYIFDNYHPVMNQEEKMIRPYNAENISVYRNYYEKDANNKEQEKSIVLSDGTYIQNTGIDYSSDSTFDVIASLSGTVTNITEDSILGKSVEIKSDNDVITTYQSLSEISVKKGDVIAQGDLIAKSGTCSINENTKNGLHFETFINGKSINPEKSYNKTLKEIMKD